MDDLGGKSIPSAPINPLLCLTVQLVGQKFIINADQSVQVSTACSADLLGVTARLLPPSGKKKPFYGLISVRSFLRCWDSSAFCNAYGIFGENILLFFRVLYVSIRFKRLVNIFSSDKFVVINMVYLEP